MATNRKEYMAKWREDHREYIRGLLCHSCNVGIGYLKDDPNRCMKAAEYLLLHVPDEGPPPKA